jgi:hypothetical protein
MRMIELETQAPKLFCIVLDIVGPPSPSTNVSISGQGFSKATGTGDLRRSSVYTRSIAVSQIVSGPFHERFSRHIARV